MFSLLSSLLDCELYLLFLFLRLLALGQWFPLPSPSAPPAPGPGHLVPAQTEGAPGISVGRRQECCSGEHPQQRRNRPAHSAEAGKACSSVYRIRLQLITVFLPISDITSCATSLRAVSSCTPACRCCPLTQAAVILTLPHLPLQAQCAS